MLPGFFRIVVPFVPKHIVQPKASVQPKGSIMVITAAHLTPWVAIFAGVLILVMPRLLNYIVAIYLIFVGVVELNGVHHFINWH
jgi:Protein of unknown function (DUF3096)